MFSSAFSSLLGCKLLNAEENIWVDSLENLEFVGQLGQGGFGNVSLLCTYDGVVVDYVHS